MRASSALVLSFALAAFVGCNRNNPNPNGNGGNPADGADSAKDNPDADVGPALYKLAGPAVLTARAAGSEPIVIQSYVQYEDRQQVSSEVEGMIELIASPLTKRADGKYVWEQPGEPPVVYDPARPHPSIVFHPRDRELYPNNKEQWYPYWKLSDGVSVSTGQILCMIDDQQISAKIKGALEVSKASAQMQAAAELGLQKSKEKIDLYKDKAVSGAIPPSQMLDDQVMVARFSENLGQALSTKAKSEADYEEARVMIRKYQIRSRVDGIIRSVAKHPGEVIRSGEKIFEIQSTEKVRLEGVLDREYERRLARNMAVTVEPAVPSAPLVSHRPHRHEVGGVAVTGHADRPLVVSAGLDGFVIVWDPNVANVKNRPAISHNLPHPVPARAVACTPPGAKEILAVTGGNDGKVRIWDLGDPAKLPTTPKHVPDDFHTSAVTAIAVSPDGKYAASAAGREVFIWDILAGKKLYSFPPEHRDSVTSLVFTPQGTLVTASKDRTIKVWKLGTERAAVARTIEHRSGVVDALGVSPDGGRMLFDQDKGRIDLVNVADGQTTGQLSNVGSNAAFGTLALFGPDRGTPESPYLVVTSGGEGDLKGVLQIWQAPKAGGRAAEIARLIAPGRVGVTCAAFSHQKDARFLVVGTTEGSIHVWTPPSEQSRQLEGRITFIDTTDPRYVTVRVEMSNKEFPLRDHTTATVIVSPEER